MDDVDEGSMWHEAEEEDHRDSLIIHEASSNEDEEGEVPMDNCDYMVGHQYS